MPILDMTFRISLAGSLDVIFNGRLRFDSRQVAVGYHFRQGFKNQIRIDGAGTISDQAAVVMNLPGFTGFDDQAALVPQALANQVVVNPGGGQQ